MLRHVVTVQKPTATADAQGGRAIAWSTRAVVRAHVEPTSGNESLQASQETAVLSTIVTVRYRSDISVRDRLVYGTRTLEIESAQDPTGFRRELTLRCSEVQA